MTSEEYLKRKDEIERYALRIIEKAESDAKSRKKEAIDNMLKNLSLLRSEYDMENTK